MHPLSVTWNGDGSLSFGVVGDETEANCQVEVGLQKGGRCWEKKAVQRAVVSRISLWSALARKCPDWWAMVRGVRGRRSSLIMNGRQVPA